MTRPADSLIRSAVVANTVTTSAVNEAEHVNLSLGTDARNRGANCHLIPDTLPGVAYVAQDGIPDPVRVRFAWHTDHDIAQLTAPPADPPVLTLVGDAA